MAADVDPLAWDAPVDVAWENADTTTLRDVSVFVRCNDGFAGDTLTVRIATLTPDSLRCEEPLLLGIARTPGPAALGQESVVPYRRMSLFGRPGTYRMTITPVRPVRGIEAVGIHIVTSE